MTGKWFLIFVLFAYEGLCVTEIRLPDRNITYTRNELNLFAPSIGIPKLWIGTLRSCHIIFPDGRSYEAYPGNTIPSPNLSFLRTTIPEFQNCAVGFRHDIATSYSGTYELVSTVLHSEDNSVSVTRKRFNLVINERV
ncbi:unnamed protein product [Euphydryas editha]|uniref:Uncharacterized protein n=1 Tax=Euphydryas editha TaxID=104508 RepID=A0AAU9TD36_EUPED|nr:unnamed protein product [Euphydryas editha]